MEDDFYKTLIEEVIVHLFIVLPQMKLSDGLGDNNKVTEILDRTY